MKTGIRSAVLAFLLTISALVHSEETVQPQPPAGAAPRSDNAVDGQPQRRQAHESIRQLANKYCTQPAWVQPALSGLICYRMKVQPAFRRAIAQLQSLDNKANANYQRWVLRDALALQGEKIVEARRNLREIKRAPLPCRGEVETLARCLITKYNLGNDNIVPQLTDLPGECQAERMAVLLTIIWEDS